jgi:hypothetical protein
MESLDTTQRKVIRRRVQDTPFSIHFSFDGLTAPNNSPLLVIVVHWMTHDGQKKNPLVGMRTIHWEYSGESMASQVWKIIQELTVAEKLDYFVVDNALNNCTALRSLEARINSETVNLALLFLEKQRWLRCFGHVLNLIARSSLFGTAVSANLGMDLATAAPEQKAIEKEVSSLRAY